MLCSRCRYHVVSHPTLVASTRGFSLTFEPSSRLFMWILEPTHYYYHWKKKYQVKDTWSVLHSGESRSRSPQNKWRDRRQGSCPGPSIIRELLIY